jgi:hypothetical protein
MAETQPPERQERRGCPAGGGTLTPAHGGRIGNPPYQRDEEVAREVRTLAKVLSQEMIAEQLGIHRSTLAAHYGPEVRAGKREAIAALGAMVLKKALAGDRILAMFYLKTQGKWNTRVELTGAGGGPIKTLDLSRYTDDQLALLEPILEQLAADGIPDLEGIDFGGAGADSVGAGSEGT